MDPRDLYVHDIGTSIWRPYLLTTRHQNWYDFVQERGQKRQKRENTHFWLAFIHGFEKTTKIDVFDHFWGQFRPFSVIFSDFRHFPVFESKSSVFINLPGRNAENGTKCHFSAKWHFVLFFGPWSKRKVENHQNWWFSPISRFSAIFGFSHTRCLVPGPKSGTKITKMVENNTFWWFCAIV